MSTISKEIHFLTKFDTSDFDKAIEKMQRQLRDVYRQQDVVGSQRQTAQRLENVGLGGILSKPTQEAFFKSIQNSRQQVTQLIKQWGKEQEDLTKQIGAHEKERIKIKEQLLKIQKDSNKDLKEELELTNKLKAAEENLNNTRNLYKSRDQAINQAIDVRQNMGSKSKMDRLFTAFKGGGLSGASSEANMMAGEAVGFANPLKLAAIIGGSIAGAMKLVESAMINYTAVPMKIAGEQASAAGNLFGTPLESIYSGKTPEDILYARQTAQANKEAYAAQKTRVGWEKFWAGRNLNPNNHWYYNATELASGLLFTGLGELGIGGQPGRLAAGHFNQSVFGGHSRYLTQFGAIENAKTQQNIINTRRAMEMNNPAWKAAREDLEKNAMRDLAFQRMGGLNYATFHGKGGFIGQITRGGFMEEQGLRAGQAIIGAGGSTRALQGSALTALQAERGFNLTNAAQVLGGLSNTLGTSGSTNQAFVRIMSESVRLGMNKADFSEENRRFVAAAQSIITDSQTTSQASIASLISRFGGFVGNNPTPATMTAAQSAYQAYVSAASATSGPQGVMRASAYLNPKNKVFSKLSLEEKAALYQIDMEHLTTDNPIVKAIVENHKNDKGPFKLTAQSIVSAATSAGTGSIQFTTQADELMKKIRSERTAVKNATDPKQKAAIAKQIEADSDQLALEMSVTQKGNLANDPLKLMAIVKGITSNNKSVAAKAMKEYEAEVNKKLTTPETGKVEDKYVTEIAATSRVMVENFRLWHTHLTALVPLIDAYNKNLMKQVTAYSALKTDAERTAYLANPAHEILHDAWAMLHGKLGTSPSNQTQAGNAKPSGK